MRYRIAATDNCEITMAIAALMGGTAELHGGEPWHMRRIRLSDGVAFSIEDSYPYGRWKVSGRDWPEYTNKSGSRMRVTPGDVSEDSPSITLAIDKTAAQIVKDIERRFLPEYRRIYALCKAEADKWQKHYDGYRAAYAYTMGAFGKNPTPSSYGNEFSGYILVDIDNVRTTTLADFTVRTPTSVELKLGDLTPEQALAIMRLRQKQIAGQTGDRLCSM